MRNIRPTRPELPQAPGRRRRARVGVLHVFGVVVALAVLVPAAAFAAFSDVAPGHPFYGEIAWMENTGISTGYPDGTYRPEEPVTRGAMSAFMARLYSVQAGLTSIKTGTNGIGSDKMDSTWQTVDSASVVVPPGTTGRVLATFSGEANCNFGDNIFVLLFVIRPQCTARINIGSATPAPPGAVVVMDSDDAANDPDVAVDAEGFAMQAASGSLGPGTYTVTAQINTGDGHSDDDADHVIFDVNEYLLSAQVMLDDPVL
jgi:hypothetical protein